MLQTAGPSEPAPAALLAPASRRRLALPAALTVAAALALALLADGHGDFDLHVYAGAMRSWVGGRPLYDYVHPGTAYGFTYPPFAALLLLPLAYVPLWLARAVVLAGDAAVITATTWWLVRQVAPRGWSPWYATACAVPLVCLLEPVRDTVGFGQINLLLVALVVLDVVGLRRGSRWAGVGVGLAAAIKLTPVVFVVLLAAARPRAARTALVTAALATAGAYAVAPATSVRFWGSALFDTSRVGSADLAANQALSGALARLSGTVSAPLLPWLVLAGALGAIGLRRAVRAVRDGDDLAGLALTGLTGAVISPISWTHHLWWVVPAIAVLVRAGWTRRRWLWTAAGVATLFASSLPDQVRTPEGQHLAHGPFVVLGESSYALALVLLVLLLPVADPSP